MQVFLRSIHPSRSQRAYLHSRNGGTAQKTQSPERFVKLSGTPDKRSAANRSSYRTQHTRWESLNRSFHRSRPLSQTRSSLQRESVVRKLPIRMKRGCMKDAHLLGQSCCFRVAHNTRPIGRCSVITFSRRGTSDKVLALYV